MRFGEPIIERDRPVRRRPGLVVGLFGREIRYRTKNPISIGQACVGGGIAGVLVYGSLEKFRCLLPAIVLKLVHFVPALGIELVGFGIFGAAFQTLLLFSAEPQAKLVGNVTNNFLLQGGNLD